MRRIGGMQKLEYEKVAVDEWLTGHIEEVQYNEHREYNHKNEETGAREKLTAPHVRFKFRIDGYEYPHYSRWMKASTYEMSNLYSKYLKYLCPQHDCQDQVIDLDLLTGAQVKLMWENNGDYQNITQLRGLDPALNAIVSELENVEPFPPFDPTGGTDEEPPL